MTHLGPAELFLLVVLALTTGALAARKGYNFFTWTFAGGSLIALIVLAFLPFTDKEGVSPEVAVKKRATGNIIGGVIAGLAVLSVMLLLFVGRV